MPESVAAALLRNIASAVKCIHDAGFVHRNLKLETLLLTSKEDDTTVKVSGFELAAKVPKEGLTGKGGSLVYIAPEILEGKIYKQEVDLWSLGVIAYINLCGYPPIFSSDERKHVRLGKLLLCGWHFMHKPSLSSIVRRGRFRFDEEYWSNISDKAKDLISGLMCVDTSKRLTIDLVLDHPWLNQRQVFRTATVKLGECVVSRNLHVRQMQKRRRK